MKSTSLRGTFLLERDRRPFWSDRGLALMAFVIPFVILSAAYAALSVFPFGGRHILTVDLFHQYAPFLAMLREKILGGGSFFYTHSVGLGTNFYALFAYYLASPLNLLLIIFPPSYLTEAVFLISVIKVGLAGFSFYHYLRISFQRRGALAVAFSTFYSLSGFVLAYSWNIMWLDTLILLPAVLLALIRLIRDGKWMLYPILVSLLLITNYYTGFFAAVFIALYFPILLLRYTQDRHPSKRAAAAGKTILWSLVGAAMAALILYPTWRSLAITSAAGDQFPKTLEIGGRPLAYLGQLFSFLQPTVRSGSPNLYCGLPVLLLVPVYFLSGRIRMREKALNGLLLIFLLLSFDVNVLNFLWHGLHYPNQLPYRYSFVFIFLLLTIAYDGLRSVREFRPTEIGLLGLSLAFVVPVVSALEPEIKLAPWTQWGTIVFLLAYTLLFSSFKNRRYKNRVQVNILLAFMLFEILLSTFSGIYYMGENEYYGNRDGYSAGSLIQSVRDAIQQLDQMNGDDDYRLELKPHKTSNDPALYGYRGLSIFASTSPKEPVLFFRDLGFYNNGINSYQYRGATLFSEALLGIRHVIAREKPVYVEGERRVVLGNDLITVYENPYVFPLAFAADPGLLDYEASSTHVFEAQDKLASALFGQETRLFQNIRHMDMSSGLTGPLGSRTVFTFSGLTEEEKLISLSWEAPEDGPYYLYLDMKGHDLKKVEIQTEDMTMTLSASKKQIHELGTLAKGTRITMEVELKDTASSSGSFDARLAYLDTEPLAQLAAQARTSAAETFSLSDDWIEAQLTVNDESLFFLSIPYDPGWTAWVDGRETEIKTVGGALMALDISPGNHKIVLSFTPLGWTEGIWISAGALLVLLAWGVLSFLIKRKKKAGARLREDLEAFEDPAESFDGEHEEEEAEEEKVTDSDPAPDPS